MIRLKYDEKPEDKNLALSISCDPGPNDFNSDRVWMTHEQWYSHPKTYKEIKNKTFVDKLEQCFDKWEKLALEFEKDGNYWPVKRPSVEFFYDEEKYFIATEVTFRDNYLFERVSRFIEEDLLSIGATCTNYTGMLD